jgi:hypothetical protein
MNSRLPTIFDDLFPDTSPEFAAIADAWPEHVVVQLLALVWDGFDRMKGLSNFRKLNFVGDYAQLERSLTDLHMDEITVLYRENGSRFESFVPKHEPWEFQNLTNRSGRPPSSDLGFVLLSNRRIRWSVEAKVLESSTKIAAYVNDLQKYLDGTVSPFSTQAALGAYLVAGDSEELLSLIGRSLEVEMTQHPNFLARPHKLSQHERSTDSLPDGMPSAFLCHHLVFSLS